MRSLIVAALALPFILVTGCSLTPKSTAQNRTHSNPKNAEKFLVAKKLEDQGKYEKSREMYAELLVREPDEPVYLHRMGVVCTRLERFGEASSYYQQARLKDPKNVSLLSDMGYAAYLRGDFVESEQLLREAVNLRPSYKKASANLALVVGRQGKFDECLELLRSTGSEASALAGLGYVHTLRGEYDLAELRFRAALEIEPNLKEATSGLADLPKKKPAKETAVADAKPVREETTEFSAAPSKTAKSGFLQQTSAESSSSDRRVTSALFVEEPFDSADNKKAVDSDEPDWMKSSGVRTANRVTLDSDQTPPKLLIKSDSKDSDDEFSRPALLDTDE